MILVVDASIVLKWFLDENHSTETQALIDERFDLHAPEVLLAELGIILWKSAGKTPLRGTNWPPA